MIETYTLGSDPEGFLFNHENGMFEPAIGLIGGEKGNPVPVRNIFGVQEDNVMVEYNIPPSEKGETMEEDIRFIVNHIEDEILKMKYEVVHVPSAEFTEEQLASDKAHEFGCEPDFDVWEECQRLIDAGRTNTRFAGGHIHFGYENANEMESVDLVKMFDLFLGVPSVLLDEDENRRKLYGKAGAFRFKEYGFEYRTLSNFWVKKHEGLIKEQISQAIDSYNNGLEIHKDKDKIIQAINESDQDTAKHLISKYSLCI